jgi:hypothetical protein
MLYRHDKHVLHAAEHMPVASYVVVGGHRRRAVVVHRGHGRLLIHSAR